MKRTKITKADVDAGGGRRAILRLLEAKRAVDESPSNPFVGSFWVVGQKSAQGPRFLSTVRIAENADGDVEVDVDEDGWTEGEVAREMERRGLGRRTFARVPPPQDPDPQSGNGNGNGRPARPARRPPG